MKLTYLFLLLTLISSCRDVEKNPTSCDYDMISEDGLCVRASYKGEQAMREVSQSKFIREYFNLVEEQYNQNMVYDLKLDKVKKELNEGDQVTNFYLFTKKISKNLELLDIQRSKLQNLYDRSYSSDVYTLMSRVETLIRELENFAKTLNNTYYFAFINSDYVNMSDEQKADYAKKYDAKVADIKAMMGGSPENFGRFELGVSNHRDNGYTHSYSINYSYKDYDSSIGQDMRNGIERYFLADENCQGDQLSVCVQDYYRDVEQDALLLFNNYLK